MRKQEVHTAIQVIDRAMLLLDVIAEAQSITLSDARSATNLPLSTIARVLGSLIAHGLVERDGGGKSYSLGLRLVSLAQRAKQRQHLTRIARPALEALVEQTSEDVGLSVLQGTVAIFLDWVEGPEPLKVVQPHVISRPEDLYYGAFRKVLLAYQHEDWIEQYISSLKFRRFTPSTIVRRSALRNELALIRSQGYAVSLEEKIRGAGAIAAPVFDSKGEIRAAIMISGPIARYAPTRIPSLAAAVKKAAAEITARLEGITSASSSAREKSTVSRQSNHRSNDQIGQKKRPNITWEGASDGRPIERARLRRS